MELHFELEAILDMYMLLALGGTCTYFRDHVSNTLKKERDDIIDQYWPDTKAFLRILTWSRAVVTGKAALAFITRNPRVLAQELEVSVSLRHSYDLLDSLEQHLLVARAWSWDKWPMRDERRPTAYLYRTPSNALLRVVCSHTASPFTPMTTSPTTALFNYFDEFSFGCAYRDLTMNLRTVAPQLPYLTGEEKQRVDRLVSTGDFKSAQWPAAVAYPPVPFVLNDALGGWNVEHQPEWQNAVCLRKRHQCPGQSRYFGDPGSLVEFFEPDMVDHAVMAHWHYPPYGANAVWRLHGTTCDNDCESGDHRLRDSISETFFIEGPLHYGSFTRNVAGHIDVGDSQLR